MKNRYLIFLALVLSCSFADAAIWRVNNNGFGAHFTSIEEVNNAYYVNPGDTIHLEGSNKSYGSNFYIKKKMTIIGAGYNFDENEFSPSNGLITEIGSVTFYREAAGSRLFGVYVNESGVSINASDIQISRCRISNFISLSYDISDIRITQNFFSTGGINNSVLSSASYFPSNVIFNHNICQRPLVLNDAQVFSECNNNIFDILIPPSNQASLKFKTGSFRNNILTKDVKTEINGNNTTNVAHNIGGKMSPFGTANNNLIVEDMAQLFVARQSSASDAQYQLKPNSAAAGKASDGGDIGVFGGLVPQNRYILSGLPPVPVIYSVSTTGVATQNGLPVTIKVRTVN